MIARTGRSKPSPICLCQAMRPSCHSPGPYYQFARKCTSREGMLMSKPLIGLNMEYRAARKDVVALSWLNTGYYESVTAAGGLPILCPPLAEDDDLKQFLKMLDGVVLCGCSLDLDPVRMGIDRHPSTRVMPSRR